MVTSQNLPGWVGIGEGTGRITGDSGPWHFGGGRGSGWGTSKIGRCVWVGMQAGGEGHGSKESGAGIQAQKPSSSPSPGARGWGTPRGSPGEHWAPSENGGALGTRIDSEKATAWNKAVASKLRWRGRVRDGLTLTSGSAGLAGLHRHDRTELGQLVVWVTFTSFSSSFFEHVFFFLLHNLVVFVCLFLFFYSGYQSIKRCFGPGSVKHKLLQEGLMFRGCS